MAEDLLRRAARLLAGSADFRDTLLQALCATLPDLGDFGFFDAVAPDGSVVRVARAHEDPATEALLRPTQWVRSGRRHDARALELAQDLAALAAPVVANAALLETLQRSEERLRMSLGAARIGTWEWRIAENTVYWSPSTARSTASPPTSRPPSSAAWRAWRPRTCRRSRNRCAAPSRPGRSSARCIASTIRSSGAATCARPAAPFPVPMAGPSAWRESWST